MFLFSLLWWAHLLLEESTIAECTGYESYIYVFFSIFASYNVVMLTSTHVATE